MLEPAKAFLVFHPFYVEFAALKYRQYNDLFAQLQAQADLVTGEDFDRDEILKRQWYAEGVATILFCALSLEAMSYHFCHEWFGKKAAKEEAWGSPADRWGRILQKKFGKTFKEDDEAYRILFRLFTIRNKLAHRKSLSHDELLDFSEAAVVRHEWVEDAVEALRTVPAASRDLTGDLLFQIEASFVDRHFSPNGEKRSDE